MEKQICDLQVKQAQLRQQKAVLESSRTDAHLSQAQRTKDAARPDFVHSGAGVTRSLDAAAAEDASQAPGKDLSPSTATHLRDLGVRRGDHWRLHRPAHPYRYDPEEEHRSCGPPCWHEQHQAEAGGDPEEGLQEPGLEGSTVLVACTQADLEQQSSQTTSPGHYTPSD
ncbi:hypothetical protein QTP70_022798, partial [Hemibagrus guttatus]